MTRRDAEVAPRPPGEEVRDQLEAERLALLGVELRARHVVLGDERRHRPAVVRLGDDRGAVSGTKWNECTK